MLDLAGPITVAFDQPAKREQFYVTEPSKTIVMSPNSVQRPLEKIIATITGKKHDSLLTSGKHIDLSLARKCSGRQSANQEHTMPNIQTTISDHPTIDLKADGDTIKDIYVTKEACATNRTLAEVSGNQTQNRTIIPRQPLVSVLSRKTKQPAKRDRLKNITTLTSGEFAQLLKTCNVTVKSVRSGDSSDNTDDKKAPREGTVVLRPSWTRGKSMAPTLKWHHTNFEPNKQLKVAKTRKACKAVSVTVAKPTHRQRKKSPSRTDDHAKSLASHALPLTQAWNDLASRDQASADTIKETSDSLEPLLLPKNSDPFLSDCDVREPLIAASNVTSLQAAEDDIDTLLSNCETAETQPETGSDVAPGEEWKCFVRMSDNSDSDKTVKEDLSSRDVTECNSIFSDMTQYADPQMPQIASNKMASIFDFGTTNVFEDFFNGDTSKLLSDDDFTNILNTNLPFLSNDVDFCDVTNTLPSCGFGGGSDWYNGNNTLACQNSAALTPLRTRLRHDVISSPSSLSCDHQMSHSFSDTDSGIHSPGSTPVKTSPPALISFDDITDANREWGRYNGCHSNLASPCVSSTSLDQEFFRANTSPSNFYVTNTAPQDVFQTSPVQEPEPQLLNMDEPSSFYTAEPYENFTTHEPTLLPLDPLPSVKSENEYFVASESVSRSPPESPFPIPVGDDKMKPKYRHSVGNWQIAVSLQPDKESKIEPSVDDPRHFNACLSTKTVDESQYRRRKPKQLTKKRKIITLGEGQLCCKVRKVSTEKGKTVHLWEFIRDILLNPEHCPTLIKWEDRQDGVFRFMQSDVVATMWGEKKRNPKMTYEKLSRAMRYYYNRGILERVDGRRLVYKFGPNAHGWKLPGNVTSQEESERTTTIVEHLCESTGLTIQTSEITRKVSTSAPASATPKSDSNSADSQRLKSPRKDPKTLGTGNGATKTAAKPALLSINSQSQKSPVTSWVVTSSSSPKTECSSALPSANVLLGKQIRLAVTH